MHVLNLFQGSPYQSRSLAIERKFSQDEKVAVSSVVNWQQLLKLLHGGYGLVRRAFCYCRAWIKTSLTGFIVQFHPANVGQLNVDIVAWRWVDLCDLNFVFVRIRPDALNLRMEVA